jgi:hypothetical protein
MRIEHAHYFLFNFLLRLEYLLVGAHHNKPKEEIRTLILGLEDLYNICVICILYL